MEERALQLADKRYRFDGTFYRRSNVDEDAIDTFHDHLNEKNADIQFNKEIEENGEFFS